MATHYIYVLLCPDTGKVRYVGKTASIYYRKLSHRNGRGHAPVERWKRRLFEDGKYATFRIIEEARGGRSATWREHWWIRYFRHQGQPILNVYTLTARTVKDMRKPRRRYAGRAQRASLDVSVFASTSFVI